MIVLYNPVSTTAGKRPLPLSLMALAAMLEGQYEWTLVDANLVPDPASAIVAETSTRSRVALLGVTVMPGPQLAQAIPVCRRVRAKRPELPIVWGGYFPTQHADTVLRAPYVDYIVRGQGEQALPALAEVLEAGGDFGSVPNLSWKRDGRIVHNPMREAISLDELPDLPYHRVDMEQYLHRDYLGQRTVAHASSFGCPFACNFCAVVAMSNRRWVAQSPARLERTLKHLARTYRVDAVQMHDMDFFISEERTAEFCRRIGGADLSWWGLGRIDTLMRYSDETWRLMKQSGLRMVFSGAESGSDETLARMNKGGQASAHLALELARRMRTYDIVPEFSFVLGAPPDPLEDLDRTFAFIRRVKRINPATEIVMYVYTPVPREGELFAAALDGGFAFPETLDEWATDDWRRLSMRRGEGIPWMEQRVRRRVSNFERVLNAFYPTVTDSRLTGVYRAALRAASAWRYLLKIHVAPYELHALQRLVRYQRPETTGF